MADTYTVQTQYQTVEFLGGTQTRQVIAVGATTLPNNVYFEVRVPASTYGASLVAAALLGPASIYEDLYAIPGVIGVEWSQGVTPSGYLQDDVTITVSSTSGNSSAQLTVPFSDLGPQLHAPQIAAVRKQLDAVEAL